MKTRRQMKERSFLAWGLFGLVFLGMFAFAPFVPSEDSYIWAGIGILGLLFCAIGHGATCEMINRRHRE